MGFDFLTKQRGRFRREREPEGKHWQMLEMSHANLRIVGVYASPSATAQKWIDINAALKRLRTKRGRMLT